MVIHTWQFEGHGRAVDAVEVTSHCVVAPKWPNRSAILLTSATCPPHALAVELHGSGLDPDRQRTMSRLVERLVPRGFAVLLPEAAIPFQLSNGVATGFAWNIPGVPLPGADEPLNTPVDDVEWVQEVIEVAQSKLALIGSPLFITGYSGGARLASYLLVKSRLQWTAAALVAGLRAVRHADHAPPPTIAFHGREDQVNPFLGGSSSRWDISVAEAADRYAVAQGCLTGFRETHSLEVCERSYLTSAEQACLTLYIIPHAAHAWPGSTDPGHLEAFGPAGADVDATALIIDFFVRFASRDGEADTNTSMRRIATV